MFLKHKKFTKDWEEISEDSVVLSLKSAVEGEGKAEQYFIEIVESPGKEKPLSHTHNVVWINPTLG